MADKTKIEWANATWNPIRAKNRATGKVGWHCEHVTEACRWCYAENRNLNTFFGNGLAYKPGHLKDIHIFLDKEMLLRPLQWQRGRKIFPCSMTDLFADFVTDEMIDQVLAVAALTPRHTYQILTKRPERMRAYMLERWQGTPAHQEMNIPAGGATGRNHQIEMAAEAILEVFPRLTNTENNDLWDEKGSLKIMHFGWPLPNVWFGVSIATQEDADRFIPDLLATPAAKRFASCEPLLESVTLRRIATHGGWYDALAGFRDVKEGPSPEGMLDWVICGGESGPQARPMHPDWARGLRNQCDIAGVPFFFKQHGEWMHESQPTGFMLPRPSKQKLHRWPDETASVRYGKSTAGRLLDGVEHSAFPVAA